MLQPPYFRAKDSNKDILQPPRLTILLQVCWRPTGPNHCNHVRAHCNTMYLHTRSKDAREIIATDRTSKRTLISTDNITMWCGTRRRRRRRRRRLRWRRTKKVDHRLKTAVRERYVHEHIFIILYYNNIIFFWADELWISFSLALSPLSAALVRI